MQPRRWHLLSVLERVQHIAGRELQRAGLSATIGNPAELCGWLAGACHGARRFVSHSSLGLDERRRAESAFAEGTDCVIVATSTLELGIDVGDLDRVIQVDAPATVSAFLQRLGQTVRRPGTRRNCLFLATSEDALLRAAGLIDLWSLGYVEPVIPPPEPLHIACCLLFEESAILSAGPEGERSFGYKNFLDIFSVFTSPPLFTVFHGRAAPSASCREPRRRPAHP